MHTFVLSSATLKYLVGLAAWRSIAGVIPLWLATARMAAVDLVRHSALDIRDYCYR